MTEYSFEDAGLAGALIGAFHTALLEALRELHHIHGDEAAPRMAQFESHVVREIKSLISEGMSEAEETRTLSPAISAVRDTFRQAAKPA